MFCGGRRPGPSAIIAALAASCLTMLGGCQPDNGFKTRTVDRDDFGSMWPFRADNGVLACEMGVSPTFTVNGNTVGLEQPDLTRRVWAADATQEQAAHMRQEALALCD